ncbi:type II toxin-antitoxin system PemK/MazF family toxin, partial [Escherichia coli]|uniref:type II toxin-antitoxin system PemK/MazF family toxin n=1 Tax=Escherichia coli TaxID=562 RepID=UPI003D8113EE
MERGEIWLVSLDPTAGHEQQGTRPVRHCCKVSDEAAFCLIQRPYISKTLLT